ncbi:hypothetical protein TrST_g7909 [Triparma strigata]|uniref:Pyruvate, phosphate dikinase n=1 Tax=Triparma strigata TaxID=1606541 RepID=A0A9W7B046_9STRA|nr:hypothetical protein TrST_g7909 [Triparma strigata]
MRLNLAFLALALAGASAFTVPQPIAFRARSAVYSSSPPSIDQRITETLSEVPCFPFGAGEKGRSADDKWLLGGKGANLAEMSSIGLSVPPGFTLTTECCREYCSNWNGELPPSIWSEVTAQLKVVESKMGCEFGSDTNPLLLSVRSGAAISMPGMMDTVLNLGMNDVVVEALSAKTGNARFAWDSYRRFLEMFGNVVLEIPRSEFEEELDNIKFERGYFEDNELQVDDLKTVVSAFKEVYVKNKLAFPDDVNEQLRLAIGAVFGGWNGDRAIKYREVENIRNLLGTAVNVQSMVFGNMGLTSGTGVCFTRDPNNGKNELFGEFLIDAQGEDVVAGIRTPQPISELETAMPEVYQEFKKNTEILEQHYGDMQDIEFTIQEGKLFMLQTRNGKRGGEAAVKMAVDFVEEGLIDKKEAVNKVLPEHLDQLLHPSFSDTESDTYKNAVVASGLPASPGAAVGEICFTNEDVVQKSEKGIPCVLVRDETSPDDVAGMYASEGILTARGGMTSHAAVVARGWGRPCICGCSDIKIDEAAGTLTITKEDGSTVVMKSGDFISLNGNTGEIMAEKIGVSPPAMKGDLEQFMTWVDEIKEIDVLANADTPDDAAEARKNGAVGIGLVRTEHMFFEPERIGQVRQLILSKTEAQTKEALDNLLPYQRSDFEGIFKAMDGYPVTIRLLDPPLHEFLPGVEDEEVLQKLSSQMSMTVPELVEEIKSAAEVNPMLGLRGCRLGITRPEIIEMQVRGIIEAALNAIDDGVDAIPDIMIPLVGKVQEFKDQAKLVRATADRVFEERGKTCKYRVGTMIEIPRAALTAHEIAEEADFFSFGSNDLTQMTFGYSRDDVGTFIPEYKRKGILLDDPFVTVDVEGVGQLIKSTVKNGREVKPELKIGVCGEHGGDPRSVEFFANDAGLSYVSCSPFRVPIARLAAAQSATKK